MALKFVKSNLAGDANGTVLSMLLADNPSHQHARETLEIKLPFEILDLPEIPPNVQAGGVGDTRIEIAALRYVRDAVTAEIQRISNP